MLPYKKCRTRLDKFVLVLDRSFKIDKITGVNMFRPGYFRWEDDSLNYLREFSVIVMPRNYSNTRVPL